MKFLGDMGISPLTTAFLRTLGHDAKHLHEEGLDTMPDPEILAKARTEGSVLLTSDLDFGDLVVASHAELPSVIIFRLQPPMRADKVNRYVERVLSQYAAELQEGAVISVTEGQIRVRRLPVL